MGKLFDLDSPFIAFLNKIADLAWLNILTLVCCIPIVTAGSSLTAMNYVLLKLVRKEEGYITKSFFKSFGQNFKQATISWIIVLLAAFVVVTDYRIVAQISGGMKNVMAIMLLAATLVGVIIVLYFYPLLSHYDNSIKNTLKNAFILSMVNAPRTVAILAISVVTVILYYMNFIRVVPFIILFGLTAPGYVNMIFFSQIFKKLDGDDDENKDEDVQSVQ